MLAKTLIEAHEKALEVPPFSATHPGLTPEAGYAGAKALHEHRMAGGWRPLGRKIGFTNRTIWQRYGVHEPMWGTVYDRTVILAERDAATVPLGGLVQPRIEPEICFGIKAAPPRGAPPEELLGCIEWIAHSVEIVHCLHPQWKVTLPDCTAANGLHGRLVVGTRIPIDKFENLFDVLPTMEVRLKKAGTEVDRGVGTNVLDGPLHALAYFLGVLARQPDAPPLAAGELVTTGTITDAHPVALGETWSTEIRGLDLPGLTVKFA
jgi:2-oxo-3-hexenedioate decarboxylase